MSDPDFSPPDQRLLHAGEQADVLVQLAANGKRTVVVKPKVPSLYVSRRQVVTSYPDDLILLILGLKSPGQLCDEIARDEDPAYVATSLMLALFAFVPAGQFVGQRVLDFGCGAGASTMVLNRLLKGADIYGVELDENLLRIAKARAVHYGLSPERLVVSPNGQTLPATLGTFDVVVLSAVWEHLLPAERPVVMKQIWSILRPGGRLFINQTPHRFSPVETHTTELPLINYLPDRMALSVARRFSRRVRWDESWTSLLRRGIRGGSQHEVMRLILRSGGGSPKLLMPSGLDDVGDLLDLWYKTSVDSRLPRLKWWMWAFLKGVKNVTGAQIVPELTLAIQKNA